VIELAAIAGVDPWPLTLRELFAAAKAKRNEQWNHTADMLALQASIHGGRVYSRSHFHPLHDSSDTGNRIDPRAEYNRIKRREARNKK
jgi:hypothetical protein